MATYGREKQKRMLTYFARLMRENFMFNFGIADLVYMSREEENFAKNFARFVNATFRRTPTPKWCSSTMPST